MFSVFSVPVLEEINLAGGSDSTRQVLTTKTSLLSNWNGPLRLPVNPTVHQISLFFHFLGQQCFFPFLLCSNFCHRHPPPLPPSPLSHCQLHLLCPKEIEALSDAWDEFTFPYGVRRPPISISTPVFLCGKEGVLMEVFFFLFSCHPSICALSLTSFWTFLCYQESILSPVYSTVLSNSWFHLHLNMFDPFHVNNKTSLNTPNPCLILFRPFWRDLFVYSLHFFTSHSLHIPPSGLIPQITLPELLVSASVRYQKGMDLHILNPLDISEHLVSSITLWKGFFLLLGLNDTIFW